MNNQLWLHNDKNKNPAQKTSVYSLDYILQQYHKSFIY